MDKGTNQLELDFEGKYLCLYMPNNVYSHCQNKKISGQLSVKENENGE